MKKIIVFALVAILVVALSASFVSAAATNVASGKTYTYTGALDTQYPDSGNELTDGTTGTAADVGYGAALWLGLNLGGTGGNAAAKQNEIVLDLGSVTEGITDFKLVAEECTGGIFAPSNVEVLVSSDKTTFTSIGDATQAFTVNKNDAANPTYGIYEYSLNSAETSARYVKFLITNGTGNWVFVSEVEVYTGGTAGTTSTTESEEASSAAESVDDSEPAASNASSATSSTADNSSKVTANESSEAEEGGMDPLVIAGIAVGVIAIIAIVVVVTKKKK